MQVSHCDMSVANDSLMSTVLSTPQGTDCRPRLFMYITYDSRRKFICAWKSLLSCPNVSHCLASRCNWVVANLKSMPSSSYCLSLNALLAIGISEDSGSALYICLERISSIANLILPLLQTVVSNQSVKEEFAMGKLWISSNYTFQSRQSQSRKVNAEVDIELWGTRKLNEADTSVPAASILIAYFLRTTVRLRFVDLNCFVPNDIS